ncbi:MAG TPA: hypothetical protein VFA01_00130 [Candidatus Dormibacteraeota bacterium]|jgi:hypothetical protein|nr:hypothetical protein [Candidatus Dormibacteraeota bacterium]
MPTERRPLDSNLASQVGKSEDEAVAWWKLRMEQIASIPTPTARAGALVPEWRELAVLPEAQRLTLTKARIIAVEQLTAEQRDKVFEARAIGVQQAPDAAAADAAFIREKVASTLPEPLQQRVRETLDRS